MNKEEKETYLDNVLKTFKDMYDKIDFKVNSFMADRRTANQIYSYFNNPNLTLTDKLCPLCDKFLYDRELPMFSEDGEFHLSCEVGHYSYENWMYNGYHGSERIMIINSISINNIDNKEIFDELDAITDDQKKNEYIRELAKIIIFK